MFGGEAARIGVARDRPRRDRAGMPMADMGRGTASRSIGTCGRNHGRMEWPNSRATTAHTWLGRRIALCLATDSDRTLDSCGTCARPRDAVIGFPARGAWRQVEAATAVRDVPASDSWVFRDHRTMVEVIAAESAAALTSSPSRSDGLEGEGVRDNLNRV